MIKIYDRHSSRLFSVNNSTYSVTTIYSTVWIVMHSFHSSLTIHSSKMANNDMARKTDFEQKTRNKFQFQNTHYLWFKEQTWQRKIFLFAAKIVNLGISYEKYDQHHIYGKSNHCASICGVLSFSFLSREGRKTKWNINIKTWWLIKKKSAASWKWVFFNHPVNGVHKYRKVGGEVKSGSFGHFFGEIIVRQWRCEHFFLHSFY